MTREISFSDDTYHTQVLIGDLAAEDSKRVVKFANFAIRVCNFPKQYTITKVTRRGSFEVSLLSTANHVRQQILARSASK